MKNQKKILLFLFAIFLVYSCFWFYTANKLQGLLNGYEIKQESWSLFLHDAKIKGFPFKMTVELNNIRYLYSAKKQDENSLELLSDKIEVSTNIFLRHFDILFPNEVTIKFLSANEADNKNIKILSKSHNVLSVTEDNFFYGYSIIKNLYQGKDITKEQFNLEQLTYHVKDLELYDVEQNKVIFKNSSNADINIKRNNGKISSVKTISDNTVNFLDPEYFGYNVQYISCKQDILIKTDNKNKNAIPLESINVNKIEIIVDDTNFLLNGIGERKDGDFILDFELKINSLNKLLKMLLEKDKVSNSQVIAINSIIRASTGENYSQNITIPIYTSKEGEIKFGKITPEILMNYLRLLISGS
jgi:hypothetical protein